MIRMIRLLISMKLMMSHHMNVGMMWSAACIIFRSGSHHYWQHVVPIILSSEGHQDVIKMMLKRD